MPLPLWLIFLLVMGAIFFVMVSRTDGPDEGFNALWQVPLVLFIFEILISGLVSIAIPQTSTSVHTVDVSYERLLDLGTADTIHGESAGALFVSQGTIDSHEVYRFFYADGQAYRRGEVGASGDVQIFLENRTDGVLKISTTTDGTANCRDKPSEIYVWLRHVVMWNACFWNDPTSTNDAVRYEFHIPKGSIRQSYNMQ